MHLPTHVQASHNAVDLWRNLGVSVSHVCSVESVGMFHRERHAEVVNGQSHEADLKPSSCRVDFAPDSTPPSGLDDSSALLRSEPAIRTLLDLR